ncbi:hypothetical protein SPHV1_2170043 [Novosphingobium sp. KN65.2]|nr:hypothetical protein SPHV1_2170043 [Novosphingobium sp. KN65.2]
MQLSHPAFVYDAAAPWDQLRSGTLTQTADGEPGVWFVGRTVEELKQSPTVHPLSDFPDDSIRPHVLMLALHGSSDDGVEPIREIYRAIFKLLRTADGRTMTLDDVKTACAGDAAIDATLVDDALRMMGSMGVLVITAAKKGFDVAFETLLEEGYKRRDYLATFTNELMAKSRRIELLVGHPTTVGNYREELLRGLLEQLLPKRYQAITGFIEGCPRQLDIIVWDTENYVPLFREQNFVVVPLAAVRAVVEVKSTLSDSALRTGLSILWDTFRNRQTVLPIFTGIFAFEDNLGGSAKVAGVMRRFYAGTDRTGLIERRHGYLWAGINAVCVPRHYLVRERYSVTTDGTFPQPSLSSVADPFGDDAYSALFVGTLLSYLESSPAAKAENNKTFEPALRALEEVPHGQIFTNWQPTRALSEIGATLHPDGANEYVRQVHDFRAGRATGDTVGYGLRSGDARVPEDSRKE